MRILNFTQHCLTDAQKGEDIQELSIEDALERDRLINFEDQPTLDELQSRAHQLVELAVKLKASHVLLGGAPYLVYFLIQGMKRANIIPVFSFTKRISCEMLDEDGNVKKNSIFQHLSLIEL